MSKRTISPGIICLIMIGFLSPAHALSKQELSTKLQAAGYSQIGEAKSTAEGTIVKAVKDGKDVRLLVDSGGQIKELQ
jgi:hypothetical protein